MSMSTWKKILVGYDFSTQADFAARQAVVLAANCGAEVILAHIRPSVLATYAPLDGMAMQYHAAYQDLLADNERRLSEAVKTYSSDGVTVTARAIDGRPETDLATQAQELQADLIVVGTHGRRGVRRFLLGSVAERVIRNAQCNVLVARGEVRDPITRILVPTDFSEPADSALDVATTISNNDCTIDLVHYWQLPTATIAWAPRTLIEGQFGALREELERAAEQELASRRERVGASAEVTTRAIQDAATHGIQTTLGETNDGTGYDLVVMGSHGRRGVKRWLLGSVAETTIRYSPCSVLIVH